MNNNGSGGDVIAALGLNAEMTALGARIDAWLRGCDPEMSETLDWQFRGGSKYFRPLTIFACCRSIMPGADCGPIPPEVMTAALVVEMMHNMTLVVDDILDRSDTRRGRATMHTRFGELNALMTSGYIVAAGYEQLGGDVLAIRLVSELIKRLGVAECLQWRLRRQVLGVEDWRRIAGEDTGSMFEICACLGDRSGRLRRFGGLLGLLYHGCDDVGDVRGAAALGGGGEADVRDGILTLPAALAIRDPAIGALFTKANPTDAEYATLAAAFAARLPDAEAYLDRIAEEARTEARLFAVDPAPLYVLIEQTRGLSR
ncbi:polyprenyl synthetase family protein [Acidiphilium sp. PA]|uniref:polyprenyl synthetase family protein n=1 Tax=Acidiphilium sp. PA TaxID=2871705 RepID=UPI0022434ACA|nr:polyprenyl synthetase family protein [Acidiphilium sp. PA]MCW8306261.1 polyprenyl synthetase family protein [Acidiphilium sp. PA]